MLHPLQKTLISTLQNLAPHLSHKQEKPWGSHKRRMRVIIKTLEQPTIMIPDDDYHGILLFLELLSKHMPEVNNMHVFIDFCGYCVDEYQKQLKQQNRRAL